MGFWQSVTGRTPARSRLRERPLPCVDWSPSPPPCSPSSLLGGWPVAAAPGPVVGPAGHRRSSTSRSAATRDTRTASRSTSRSGQPIELDVTADEPGEIHVHSSPGAGVRVRQGLEHHRGQADHRRRGASTSSRTRSTRPSFIAPGRSDRLLLAARRTASAARRTCRSRASSPSSARPRPLAVSFVVLVARLAQPAVRRRDQRPAGTGLAGPLVDSTRLPRAAPRRSACCCLLYLVARRAVRGKDLLTNPIFGMFYVWIWVGMVPASLLFGRVWKAISPVRLINARPRPGLRRRPRRRASSPTPSGSGCGRPRSACSRSSGWSWSTRTTSSSGRSGCGARSTSRSMLIGGALFGNTFYEQADPFEVYSSPGRPAVDLGPPRRRPAGRPQPAGQPRHRPRRARAWSRWSRCCSAARRSTRSATPRGG